jgi:2-polyprenyl-6-methoxyphenol hydroxylase-like FAD-dependent oxidoreductase
MNGARLFDIAILGGGPTGLVAALAASKHGRTALIVDRLPTSGDPLRIEVIPARTLALLVELGIDPRVLGVDCLHSGAWSSWETASPKWRQGAQTAHIERPRLELALFDSVRCAGVQIFIDRARPYWAKGFIGNGWRTEHLIDATGRASVMAQSRKRYQHPWASCFYWAPRSGVGAMPEFRIAALPLGYVYRLASADKIGIGIVGRGPLLKTGPERIPKEGDLGWLFDGMSSLQSMRRGPSGACSVQWAMAGRAVLCGDASVARDALSSQGLAACLSDALYTVASVTVHDRESLRRRQSANLSQHLTYLKESLSNCRFRDQAAWSDYERFINANVNARRGMNQPTLRDGRLV